MWLIEFFAFWMLTQLLWRATALFDTGSSDSFYVSQLAPYVRDQVKQLRKSSSHEQAMPSAATCTSNTTLYGSTQTAVILAELAAEAGNQTFFNQTLWPEDESGLRSASCGTVANPSVTGGSQDTATDGFYKQSAKVGLLLLVEILFICSL